jgi:uncharacterized protein (DUF4415 family)
LIKKKVPELTDEEEARIQELIASDPDAPEATDEELAQARPFAEVHPELMASIIRMRGRPRVEHPKEKVTIRLDADVLEKLREGGPGWQSRVNDQLRRNLGL